MMRFLQEEENEPKQVKREVTADGLEPFDWRSTLPKHPVDNQYKCAADWAFAYISSI